MELARIPFEDVRLAYAAIDADEDKHRESGRDLLEWLSGAAHVDATSGSLSRTVHERAGADRP